jgi:hypothetical protein
MKKNKILLLLMIILLAGCKAQEKTIKNISCEGTITVQYDKIKKGDKLKPFAKKELRSFTVYFMNDFKDTILGYVNEKKVFEKLLNRDANLDNLNDYFGYDYSKDKALPVLKIVSKTNNSCFDIQFDKNYKLIYVFRIDGKWVIRYSNIYYIN